MQRSQGANGFARKGWGLAAAAAAIGCLALLPAGAQAATKGSSTQCPGTFTVLHNDAIGALKLPAGRYTITVLTEQTLSCQSASKKFAKFLRRPDGNLPNRWRLNARKAVFRKGKRATGLAFSVAPFRGAGNVGGGGGGGSTRTKCPTFQVLHNDRIGSLPIPAGTYLITAKNMSCPSASQQFAKFLQSPSGRLGGGWQLKPRKAKFRNPSTRESFRIKQQ